MKNTLFICFAAGILLFTSCSNEPENMQAEAMRSFYLQGQGEPEPAGNTELSSLSTNQKAKLADKLKQQFPGVNMEDAKKKYQEMKDDPKVQELKKKMLSDIGS